MNAKESELAAQLLDAASDRYGNHGCNDWDFPEVWTFDEKVAFVREYHEYNGDPHEFDINHLHLPDYAVMSFLAHKLRKASKAKAS